MAQLAQNFDATQVEPMQEFVPLPEGEYIAIIEDSEMRATKAGTGNYLSLTLQIVEGDHTGRKLFDNLNLDNPNPQTVEIAQRTLSSICHAVGELAVNDSEQLHNKAMMIKVGFQKDNKDRNQVKSYKKLEGGVAPVQPAVASVAQSKPAQAQQAGATAPWKS